ncbi:MAG: PQQ-like beta-propeller repeat protein [Planctomycetes bacterium]|nr:PQQ-like beta-propeller repeat protein [Planctomycetota bacterium]
MLKFTASLALVLFSTAHAARADNWGHWRGPTGNGAAEDASPPTEWSDRKNVKWKVAIPGKGSGSPVIWGDKVFVVTAVTAAGESKPQPAGREPSRRPGGGQDAGRRPEGGRDSQRRPSGRFGRRSSGGGRGGSLSTLDFKLLCFERKSGKLLWQQSVIKAKPHEGTHSTNGFASGSPCTDGEHVYATFGSRGLYCYTLSGKLKWKRTDFGKLTMRNGFGEGSSPTIAGELLIVPWDHEGQSSVYALNKITGKTIWRTSRDEPSCWATPLVVEHKGKKQVVLNGQTCARGYDLATGKELWRCSGQTQRPVASPVAGNGLVFVGSGFRGSFLGAFRLDGKGDIEKSKSVAWVIDRDTPDIASPLYSSGRVYFYKGKSGMLSCVDAATGKPHYTVERISGINSTYASPIAAGGHVYLTGRGGTTVVIKDAGKLEVVATNSLGEGIDATPAPAGKELFIRGEKHLFCISK